MEKQPLNRIKVMLAERMLTNKQLAEMLGTLSTMCWQEKYGFVQVRATWRCL